MARATRPRTKTRLQRRGYYNGRPPMARQDLAPSPHRAGLPRDGTFGARSLVPSRLATRTRYNRQATLASHCLRDSPPALLYLRRETISATPTIIDTCHIKPAVLSYFTRAGKVRYKLKLDGCNNLCADSMRPYMQLLVGAESLGAKTLEILTTTLAK
jgi:hypothetical protein